MYNRPKNNINTRLYFVVLLVMKPISDIKNIGEYISKPREGL